MVFEYFSYAIKSPKKDKSEDYLFICSKEGVCGVLDGVGGWKEKGIDPCLFPEDLAKNCIKFVQKGIKEPIDILSNSYKEVLVEGSSTICLVCLENSTLKYSNIGDTGLKIIRNEKVVYSSSRQLKGFNRPFQIGYFHGKRFGASKTDAESKTVNIKPGDYIVIGSDGLFDNLFDEEIIKNISIKGDPAKNIVEKAYEFSLDKQRESPFSKESNGLYFGGKKDDITAIVIKIK